MEKQLGSSIVIPVYNKYLGKGYEKSHAVKLTAKELKIKISTALDTLIECV